MALVIPEGFANFILTITNGSGGLSARSSIAIGAKLTAPLTQGDVGRIANLLRDGLTALYDNSWIFGPTHVLENQGGPMKVWDDGGTEAGTGATGAYAPPGLAYVVSKKTGYAGRQNRGRLYLPGVGEAAVDEAGIIAGVTVNSLQAAFDALKTALVADAAITELSLFHDESSPAAGTASEITSFLVRNVVGSMRPRQRR